MEPEHQKEADATYEKDAETARLRGRVRELEGLLLLVVKQALGTGPQEPTDAELIDLTNRIMGALAQPAPGGARGE